MNWWIWMTGERRTIRQNRSTRGKNGPSATLYTTNPLSIGIDWTSFSGARRTQLKPPEPWQDLFIRLLGGLRNCEKWLLNFVMSVRPQGTRGLPLDGFSWNFVLEYFFFKCVGKIQVSLKSDKKNGYFTWRTVQIFDHISLSSSFNEKFFRQKL